MPPSLSAKKNTRDGDGHLANTNNEYRVNSGFWEKEDKDRIKEQYLTAQKDGKVLHEKLDGRGVLPSLNPMNIARSHDYNTNARDSHINSMTATHTARQIPFDPPFSQSEEWMGLNSKGRQAYLNKQQHVIDNTASRDGTYSGERESFPTGSLSSPNQGGDRSTFLPPVNHKERLATGNVRSPNQGGNDYTHHPPVHHKERLTTGNVRSPNQGGNDYTHHPPVHHKERLATGNLSSTNQGGTDYAHHPPVHHKERLATSNLSSTNQGGDHYTHHPPPVDHKGKGKSYPPPTFNASGLPQTGVNAVNRYMPSIQEASSPAHSSSSPYNNAYPAAGSASRPLGSNNAYPGQAGPNRAPYVSSGGNPSTSQYTEGRQSDESSDAPSYRTTPGSNECIVNDPNLNRAPSYASHAPAATYGQASTSNAGASGSSHDRSRTRQSSSKHRS